MNLPVALVVATKRTGGKNDTDALSEIVLELRAGGMTYAQIAAEVGLSVSWVGELVRAEERQRILGLS